VVRALEADEDDLSAQPGLVESRGETLPAVADGPGVAHVLSPDGEAGQRLVEPLRVLQPYDPVPGAAPTGPSGRR